MYILLILANAIYIYKYCRVKDSFILSFIFIVRDQLSYCREVRSEKPRHTVLAHSAHNCSTHTRTEKRNYYYPAKIIILLVSRRGYVEYVECRHGTGYIAMNAQSKICMEKNK